MTMLAAVDMPAHELVYAVSPIAVRPIDGSAPAIGYTVCPASVGDPVLIVPGPLLPEDPGEIIMAKGLGYVLGP